MKAAVNAPRRLAPAAFKILQDQHKNLFFRSFREEWDAGRISDAVKIDLAAVLHELYPTLTAIEIDFVLVEVRLFMRKAMKIPAKY